MIDPNRISRLRSLGGAVEQEYARAAGVPTDRIVVVGTQDAGLEAVVDGDADAFALTSVSLRSCSHPPVARRRPRSSCSPRSRP